jgi:hypothetical protein
LRPSSSLRQPGRRPALFDHALGGPQNHGSELALLENQRTPFVQVEVLALDALVLGNATGQEPFVRLPLCLRPAHPARLGPEIGGAR